MEGVHALSLTPGGGGGLFDGASYCEPKKIHEPEILHPKNTWQTNSSTQKIQDLNTSIMFYSIKQTLRPKRIRDRSLTVGVSFQPKKFIGPPPPRHVYYKYPPWELNFAELLPGVQARDPQSSSPVSYQLRFRYLGQTVQRTHETSLVPSFP